MADALVARLIETAAQFATVVLVGAMLPGFLLGIAAALATPMVWRWASGKIRAWWVTDNPERAAIKAAVACARVPVEHRPAVLRGLRTLGWGENLFRDPIAPHKAEERGMAGIFTVHADRGASH